MVLVRRVVWVVGFATGRSISFYEERPVGLQVFS